MKLGDQVRFVDVVDQGDEDALMTVIEDRGDRVLVMANAHAEWAIPPTACYRKEDLCAA